MPLYDFECEECGERFEELARAAESPACPRCGARETRRLFSRIAGPQKWHIDRRFAADSDARRADREARRLAEFSEKRKRFREEKRQSGGGPAAAGSAESGPRGRAGGRGSPS